MLCRDLHAALVVRDEMGAAVPGADIRVIRCDLASFASVRECAHAVRKEIDGITVLINNAGRVSTRHRMSEDGFELTFATNHLGPFLLTSLLLDRMNASGRIINVASHAHYRGRLALERVPDAQAPYSGVAAYAQSKLANVLHTFALARRLSGTAITANCLHPGVVATNLLPRWLRMLKPLTTRVIDAERGARTTLHLALSDEVAALNGCYLDEHQSAQPASPQANDVQLQESLWKASERWVFANHQQDHPR